MAGIYHQWATPGMLSYQRGKEVGSGSYSRVYEALVDNQVMAVKVFKHEKLREPEWRKYAINEVEKVTTLQHVSGWLWMSQKQSCVSVYFFNQ